MITATGGRRPYESPTSTRSGELLDRFLPILRSSGRLITKEGGMADLVSMAVLGAVLTGILGWVMIRLLGRRSEALDLFTLSAVTVAAMAAGTLTASKAMYLPGHDLVVVLVVLAGGTAVSLLTAWLLGQRVSAAGKRARAHEAARRELIAWLS